MKESAQHAFQLTLQYGSNSFSVVDFDKDAVW